MAKTRRIPAQTAADVPFRRILVPSDLTPRSRQAFRLALALARPGETRVIVLHVIQTVPGLAFMVLEPFYKQLERKARERLSALTRGARTRKVDIEHQIVYGPRAEEIVRFATRTHVDLIALTSHRVGEPPARHDWGTISYKVGLLAPCAVLLVK